MQDFLSNYGVEKLTNWKRGIFLDLEEKLDKINLRASLNGTSDCIFPITNHNLLSLLGKLNAYCLGSENAPC